MRARGALGWRRLRGLALARNALASEMFCAQPVSCEGNYYRFILQVSLHGKYLVRPIRGSFAKPALITAQPSSRLIAQDESEKE